MEHGAIHGTGLVGGFYAWAWRSNDDGGHRSLRGRGEPGHECRVRCGPRGYRGQTAAGLAEHAKSLYGERYGEFLDNVKAFAYFPYAIATGIDDFRQGEISLRFKPLSGRIDQGAGILFNLKPNGDYLTVRANALENNLVLWKFEKGRRSSVKWVRDVPTPTKTWHDLKVVIKGTNVEGYLNGKHYLTHQLPEPVSGKIGVWSKADSHMYIDDYRVIGGS